MVLGKAINSDIVSLVDLRVSYLREDLGEINAHDLSVIKKELPDYYARHFNNDLMAYVAREDGEIVACALLLIVEKPMSPSFITGKTGMVLNVYTKPEYRHRGYAKQLMLMLLEDAKNHNLSVIELKATEDGYALYKSVGFEDVPAEYHNMKIKLI